MRYLFVFLCALVIAGFIGPKAQAAPSENEVGCPVDTSTSTPATLTASLSAEMPTSIALPMPMTIARPSTCITAPEVLRRVLYGATATFATLSIPTATRGKAPEVLRRVFFTVTSMPPATPQKLLC